jgi:hypothetical protein
MRITAEDGNCDCIGFLKLKAGDYLKVELTNVER